MAIICIEGMDAIGKATQSKILADKLNAGLFAFPNYDTPAGKLILGNLKNDWYAAGIKATDENVDAASRDNLINAYVLQSLMLSNRLEMSAEMCGVLKDNRHLILDRYDASAMVYGGLDGVSLSWLKITNDQLRVRPDVYILLDAPVDVGFNRRPERRDRYESNRPFLEKVRIAYLTLFTEMQNERAVKHTGPRWYVVNAAGTIDEVASEIWSIVDGVL